MRTITVLLAVLMLTGCARTRLSAPGMGGLVYDSTRDSNFGDVEWESIIEDLDPETGAVIRRTTKKARIGSASGVASPVIEAQGAIVNAAIIAGFELGQRLLRDAPRPTAP